MKLKILYAARNNSNAKLQLERFIQSISNKPYNIRIAAYKKSSPENLSIDYTLNCLYDLFDTSIENIDNEYLEEYYKQIKFFNPDLIISDLEYYTSYIAQILNIPIWQCSSSLINYGINYNERSFKEKNQLLSTKIEVERNKNIIYNSNGNFIYSHFGDLAKRPKLKENFQWIRPYHFIGKKNIIYEHNIVSVTLRNNLNIFNFSKKIPDSIVFSYFNNFNINNIKLKNLNDKEEYINNLKNTNFFICEGQITLLADAYYNNKFSIIFPDFYDLECITNSLLSEKYEIGSILYRETDIDNIKIYNIKSMYRSDVYYLHEKLELI